METIEFDTTTETGLAAYEPFRNQLAEMKASNANAVFAYDTPKGAAAARSHIYGIRKVRGALEKARKEAKAFFLEQGRKVDIEAKEIQEELDAMIAVHEGPLLEIEQREAERVAGIRSRIAEIEHYSKIDASNTAHLLRSELEDLQAIAIDESFAEFHVEATGKHTLAVRHLTDALAVAEKREAQEAELERLRKAETDRLQAEREQRIADEAAAKATADAEAKAKAEREQAERDAAAREKVLKDEADRKEREAKAAKEKAEAEAKAAKEREDKAERDRIEAQRKADADKAAAVKAEQDRQAEEAARVERERLAREADKKHRRAVIAAAEDALREIVGTDAEAVVQAIIDGKVPHCRIVF